MSTPMQTPDQRPVLVVGATGKTGRHVVDHLTAAGVPVRPASRATGFDWERPETWGATLAGARSAYVAFVPDLAVPGADAVVGAFAREAADADLEHLVLLAGRGEAGAEAAEAALAAAGVPWTVLRAAYFTQNFTGDLFGAQVAAGELALPVGDVREPFVDTRDIGEVAARVLRTAGHAGRTYDLTGPELLTFADVADVITAAGHPVRFVPVTAEEFRAGAVAAGVPEALVDLLLAIFGETLDGRNARLGDGVAQVLGRPPRPVREHLTEAVRAGRLSEAGVLGMA